MHMINLNNFDLGNQNTLREFLGIKNNLKVYNKVCGELIPIENIGYFNTFNNSKQTYRINGKEYLLNKEHRIKEFKQNYLESYNYFVNTSIYKLRIKVLNDLLDQFYNIYNNEYKFYNWNYKQDNYYKDKDYIYHELQITYNSKISIYYYNDNTYQIKFSLSKNHFYLTDENIDKEFNLLNKEIEITKKCFENIKIYFNENKELLQINFELI